MKCETLFFELIRVAIGTQERLSRLPLEAEWEKLFDMAVKQSLVGVCFVGLQQLGADSDDGFSQIGMSEDLYLNWMGMAAQIGMKNETVNQQCVELQKRLAADGIRSSILKGQAVAMLYGEELHGFRQSGDIDIYVDCSREKAIEYARSIQGNVDWDYKHLHLKVFDDTEVEMHYVPEVMFNLLKNRTLRNWGKTEEVRQSIFSDNGIGMLSPSAEFNLVYLLVHMCHHIMSEGCGLRQFMDYYFLLKSVNVEEFRADACKMIDRLGMKNMAGGVMWVLREAFGMDEKSLLLPVNEKAGRFLLADALRGGNFGKHDKSRRWGKALYPVKLFCDWFTRDLHILLNVSSDAMWYPVWVVFHFIWKRLWALRHRCTISS